MSESPSAATVFGTGEMAALIPGFDWQATSLGALENWPATVKSAVAMILRSPLPIVSLWGEEGVMIYNDAYSAFAGTRHPSLLGSRVREGWPEVADFNDNVIRKVFREGGTLSYMDQLLMLDRGSGPQQVWLNLDYSQVVSDDGTPLGVIAIVVETTEKVATDLQLRDERMRLTQMYEQSASFMALLEGPEHLFVIVNDAFRSLAGGRDLVGKTVRETLPEALLQGYVDLLDQVFRNARPYYAYGAAVDLPSTTGDEIVRRHVDFIYQPITDHEGKVRGIFVNGIDVTESIAAQEARRASEEQFRTFAQAMPNHIWTSTPDGRLDWFNQRVNDYSGYVADVLAGNGWVELIHPDDRIEAGSAWRDALSSGNLYETEFRIRRADGDYRWHLVRGLPIRNEAGAIIRWIGINTDIHEQKLAEFSSTRDLERIWNLSPVLKMIATPSGEISSVNPAWTRCLGWTADESIGRDMLRFLADEGQDKQAERLKLMGTEGAMARSQSRLLTKDGQTRLISWTSVSDDGTIYAFGRDITTEVETAQALKASEAALAQAQKMEAIGQLTGGIAHDFNNLLQVVSGNLQLLEKELDGHPKAQQRVLNAMEGVNRGARLAAQLLAFGRRQPLAPKVVNLSRLVRDMDEMLRRALGEAIEIETIIGGGLWNTFIDPGNIENALLNLTINARDAMGGSGKLTIETANAHLDDLYAREHPEVSPGQYVMLAVSDTGIGIPGDVMAKVFDPFFTTKPEGKGTGLGLSMVYGFVKQSGGHVKIYSEVGEGTTVKLYLPRSTQAEDELVMRSSGPIVGGEETILVAEDEPAVRQTVVETLSDLGYRVLQAPDAGAALAILESGIHIDLLFTDVVMPGPVKATDLARKAVARLPDLKVLFTSGYTENSIVHGGKLDDGVELLSKPYAREALAWKIRSLLGQKAEAREKRREDTAPTTAAPKPEPRAAKGLTILVCEDEVLIRMSSVDMVEELGHTALEAGKAGEALSLLSQHPVDVLLTDVGLPDMNGVALVAEARQSRPDLPVIYATGHTQIDGVQPDSSTRILVKPFGPEQLARALAALKLKSA